MDQAMTTHCEDRSRTIVRYLSANFPDVATAQLQDMALSLSDAMRACRDPGRCLIAGGCCERCDSGELNTNLGKTLDVFKVSGQLATALGQRTPRRISLVDETAPGAYAQGRIPPPETTLVNFKPHGDRVLVRLIEESASAAGSVLVPDSTKEPPLEGVVLAVGRGRWDLGRHILPEARPGQHVLWAKYSGIDIDVDGEALLLLRDEEILGTRLRKESESLHGQPAVEGTEIFDVG